MNVEKLRVRKISKQEKYKIYDTDTKEIVDIYDSRLLAHKAMIKLKKKVKFNNDVVIVHIKDGKNIKEQIKEQIKK